MNDVDTYLASVRSRVNAHGWIIQAVAATNRQQPQFHYTVGLYPIAGFEIIAFGMDLTGGGLVLDELARRVHRGTRFTNGQVLTNALEDGHPVTMLDVPQARGWLTIARLLYTPDRQPLHAWQMIIPDADLHLPWDPQYHGFHQPVLAPPPT